MKTILLAEDHDTLRRALVRALESVPGAHILDTPSAREAMDFIDASPPDLLISDLDLLEGSGLDVLSHLHACGLQIPVIFVTAYLGEFRARIPTGRNIEVHEKPIEIAKLRALVEKHLAPTGPSVPFSAVEYVQLACLGRHSLCVRVDDETGDAIGRIVVANGELWSAQAGPLRGIDALASLVSAEGLVASCEPAHEPFGRREFSDRWESVLLDATRVADEAGRDGDGPDETSENEFGDLDNMLADDWPPIDLPWEADTTPPGQDRSAQQTSPPGELMAVRQNVRALVEDLIDEATDAMLDRNYDEAERALREALALDPEHRSAKANIERLREIRERS